MKSTTLMLIVGILSVIGGIFALLNPFAASIAAEQIAGVLGLISFFQAEGWTGKLWALLVAVVSAWVGIELLGDPLGGVLALTFVVGVSFVVSGVFKVLAGFSLPSSNLRWIVVISGALSAILGFMILSNFPGSAVVSLGVLLGVELLSTGVSMIALSSALRSDLPL
jgi:uncharacterized membrane protein HdeD (DUF308 family)